MTDSGTSPSQRPRRRFPSAPQRVIIAGFGPVGRAITERLEQAGACVVVIELNPSTVSNQSRLGRQVVHGDATDPAVLREAGIETADALVLTVPDQRIALDALRAARRIAPEIFVAVRVNHLSEAFKATQCGADHVTVEELVTAEAMQQAVMRRFEAEK